MRFFAATARLYLCGFALWGNACGGNAVEARCAEPAASVCGASARERAANHDATNRSEPTHGATRTSNPDPSSSALRSSDLAKQAQSSARADAPHADTERDPTPLELTCPESTTLPASAQTAFSVAGYRARSLPVRGRNGRGFCVLIAWPSGKESNAGKLSSVARHIDDGWFRAIENTLVRIPEHHAELVRRIVIDNHPTQHGIAAFDRADPKDGRDGRTIWLNEHLFMHPNHWERGVRGDYFAYHTSEEGSVFDDAPADHQLFSPILLHEIGHLVMYHVVNPAEDPLSPPACAKTCSDDGTCTKLSERAREQPCISPYCRPFKFLASTENWAEQYRFYYQSSVTRALLAEAGEQSQNCLSVLAEHDRERSAEQALPTGGGAPWQRGLPDMASFRPSRWDSCGGRACKKW